MEKKEGTAGTEVIERTPEQIKAEEAEGEAAFAAGVAKTTGKEEKPVEGEGETKTGATDAEAQAAAKATAEAEAKAKADAEAKAAAERAAADPWKDVPAVVREEFKKLGDSVTSQMRNISGHIGNFKQQLERISTTAKAAAEGTGAAAPTKLEIAEALSDPEKWKQLQEDFPEWMAPVAAEFTRLRKEMAAVAKSAQERPAPQAPVAAEPVNTAAIVAEAEERAYVRFKHPDWKAICATPEFAKDWLPKQSDDIKAKAASDSAEDAIAVFDAYKTHRQKLADDAAAKARQDKRLAGAVPATGSPEPPVAGISDEEAFDQGVKKTLRKAS